MIGLWSNARNPISNYIMAVNILDNWDLKIESYEDVKIRYSGFGYEIFRVLEFELPLVLNNLKFFQPLNQPEDVIAYYKLEGKEFAIQLDPLCEVICLWDNNFSIEITFFVQDYCNKVLEIIKTKFL